MLLTLGCTGKIIICVIVWMVRANCVALYQTDGRRQVGLLVWACIQCFTDLLDLLKIFFKDFTPTSIPIRRMLGRGGGGGGMLIQYTWTL